MQQKWDGNKDNIVKPGQISWQIEAEPGDFSSLFSSDQSSTEREISLTFTKVHVNAIGKEQVVSH